MESTPEQTPQNLSHRIVHINQHELNPFIDNTIQNTKYTKSNFVPKNLLEQFSRFMNRYFLLIGVLQLWPEVTPVNPITTWAPLALIFTISAVKELYDDTHRHQMDNEFNNRLIQKLVDGNIEPCPSKDALVGDLLYIYENEEIPADIVVLATCNPDGSCFIQTANLDGETNLKPRNAIARTSECSLVALSSLKGSIKCALPNAQIYKFDSVCNLESINDSVMTEDPISLSKVNFIPQATFLKNTEWIVGCVVYSGNETKISNNKRLAPTKWTQSDQFTNYLTGFIFGFQILLVVILGSIGNGWKETYGRNNWYLYYTDPKDERPYESLIIPIRFELLMSIMIPISLKVTLDICKYYYALFINWDLEMWDPDTGPANAASTSISEDLGQLEYVFSDKTGTLTENIMEFRQCSIGPFTYGNSPICKNAHQDLKLLQSLARQDPLAVEFFRCMTLCHTVVVSTGDSSKSKSGNHQISQHSTTTSRGSTVVMSTAVGLGVSQESLERVYKASSPDEEALVSAADKFGISFLSRDAEGTIRLSIDPFIPFQTYEDTANAIMQAQQTDPTSMFRHISPCPSPTNPNRTEVWETLHVLDFNSVRKRMSVIVRNSRTQNIVLYTKGADDVMFSCSSESSKASPTGTAARRALESFSTQGLRTLIIAYKPLSDQEYTDWNTKLQAAKLLTENRDDEVDKVYAEIELQLTLLGCTAIEDRLQFQVPEAIRDIRAAGIRIWMLTGDKYLTAKQIAISCNLLQPADVLFSIEGRIPEQVEECLHNCLSQAMQKQKPFCIIIRGVTLDIAMARCESLFLQLSLMARSVLCCRTTPQQKAQVVKMVKRRGYLTLAIGDGGNDTAMIQEANIGVGIMGREGLQAARAADYSIGKFRFLKRLILIHGRLSYLRTALITQYSFYKSIMFSLINVSFSFVSGFSGSTFFNTFAITTYNAVFSALLPLAFLFSKDISDDTILAQPRLYLDCQLGLQFNWKSFLGWFIRAIYHAFIIFFFTMGIYGSHIDGSNGVEFGYQSVPMAAYCFVMVLQILTVFFESVTITWVHHLFLWFSFFGFFTLMILANILQMDLIDSFYVFFHLYGDPVFWLMILLGVVAALYPILYIQSWNYNWNPTASEYCRKLEEYAIHNYISGQEIAAATPEALFQQTKTLPFFSRVRGLTTGGSDQPQDEDSPFTIRQAKSGLWKKIALRFHRFPEDDEEDDASSR